MGSFAFGFGANVLRSKSETIASLVLIEKKTPYRSCCFGGELTLEIKTLSNAQPADNGAVCERYVASC